MRLVRWIPQERVDVPDITAMSFLVLGEFRRLTRGLLLGPGTSPATERHQQRIVKGFLVEPQAVPDTTIRVRLDPGGDILGFAVGGESLGARIDLGALIGGDDAAGNTEGNATTSLDFTGLPADTYIVEMRAVYADGATDNRAFWNPSSNTEFTASVNTRHLPAYELKSPPVTAAIAGDEYMTLGLVVWDGVGPITASEITDARTQIFEGTTTFFQSTTQAGASGGGDFDRATTRDVVQINEVYPALRALQRQIRDLKGPNEVGLWDWFSRIAPPNDPTTLLTATTTKHLRSVDTVTYTVGDGTTSFGDFDGTTGLEDCLQHLEVMGGDAPQHVRIVLKSHSATPITFLISTAHTFDAVLEHLEIDCGGQSISCTHFAGTVALEAGAETNVIEVYQAKSIALTNNATFIDGTGVRGCKVRLHDIDSLVGDATVAAADLISILDGSRLVNVSMTGRVDVQPRIVAAVTNDDLDANRPIVFMDCQIDGVVDVNDVTATFKRQPVKFIRTGFVNTRTHALGQNAVISITGTGDITFDDCDIAFQPDNNGVEINNGGGNTPQNIQIKGTKFYCVGTPATGNRHALQLGSCRGVTITNSFFYINDIEAGAIEILATVENLTIDTCSFYGADLATRAQPDNSAIYIFGNCNEVKIVNCTFDGWDPNTTTDRCIVAAAGANIRSFSVQTSIFENNGGYCVQLNTASLVDLANISNNVVDVTAGAGKGFDLEGQTRGVCNNNALRFQTGATPGIDMGTAAGNCVCSGNRLDNGIIVASGSAVAYGRFGGGGPVNLNYET